MVVTDQAANALICALACLLAIATFRLVILRRKP